MQIAGQGICDPRYNPDRRKAVHEAGHVAVALHLGIGIYDNKADLTAVCGFLLMPISIPG